jgi:hypothetical protein
VEGAYWRWQRQSLVSFKGWQGHHPWSCEGRKQLTSLKEWMRGDEMLTIMEATFVEAHSLKKFLLACISWTRGFTETFPYILTTYLG